MSANSPVSCLATSHPKPQSTQSLKRRPRDLAKLAQRRQLAIAQLDVGRADHTGIDSERVPHLVVRLDARVVAHDEVVAAGVAGLVLAHGAWEHEDAPVLDVADDAAVAEDQLAGCEDDSGGVSFRLGGACGIGWIGWVWCWMGRGRETYSLTSARLPGRTCEKRGTS